MLQPLPDSNDKLASSGASGAGATWVQRAAWRERWRRIAWLVAIVLGSGLASWAAWGAGIPAWSGLDRLAWDSALHARGAASPEAVAAMPQARDILCVQASHAIPRRLLARLVRKLSQARVVALDFMLVDGQADLTPDEAPLYASDIQRWKQDDALLASAIRANGRVLLALWPESSQAPAPPPALSLQIGDSTDSTAEQPAAEQPATEQPAAEQPATAQPATAQPTQAQGSDLVPKSVPRDGASGSEWRSPSAPLVRAARGLGHVVIDEEDGVQRRVALWEPARGGRVPCMGLAMAALASRQAPEEFARGKRWDLDGGSAVVDWLGGAQTFGQMENSINYDVALGWNAEDFKDKIIIVGEVSRQSKEIGLTPWGEAPRMQAHANVAAMLLGPLGPIATPSSTWALALGLGAALLVVAGAWRIGLWGSGAWALALGVLALPACAWALASRHMLLPISVPLGAGALAFNGLALYEHRHARRVLGMFIGVDVIARVLHPLSRLEPGDDEGRTEEATAFFCDLRGYSTLAELLPPRQTATLINAYTTRLLLVVARWGGRVIDYQGDGMFVLFEALPERAARHLGTWSHDPQEATRLAPMHATRAAHAALEVVREMTAFDSEWQPVVGHTLSVGVGLQSGAMQIGIIGSRERVHFGAVGDPVNVASRVQGFSKELDARVIVAHGTHQALRREGSLPAFESGAHGIEIQSFGPKDVRGRKQAVHVWGLRQQAAPPAGGSSST